MASGQTGSWCIDDEFWAIICLDDELIDDEFEQIVAELLTPAEPGRPMTSAIDLRDRPRRSEASAASSKRSSGDHQQPRTQRSRQRSPPAEGPHQ